MQIYREQKSEVAIYKGKKYRRYPDSKRRADRVYFKKSCSKQKNKYLHIQIYQDNYGDIPSNCHIHHKDHNPLNNDVSNLQLVKASKHLSEHAKEYHLCNKDLVKKKLNSIRELAAIWHGSEEGKKWHKEHYENNKDKFHKKFKRKCFNCDIEHESCRKEGSSYCSNKCKSAYRRKKGFDDITKQCEACKKQFTSNKYKRVKTCSRKCAASLRSNDRRLPRIFR